MLGLAVGGKTYKLKFGHRGANHPVRNEITKRVEITSHNHGFAVDPDSLNLNEIDITHVNLNDQTLEGFRHRNHPVFCVQYHPEAAPGPHDSHYLFDDFMIEGTLPWTRERGPAIGVPQPMPRRNDLHRILIIGSGPIIIGQACEFDYSGTQAAKALRADGYEVILVNSNPATIMTDPDLADKTYVEPLTAPYVEEIIRRERPDALLSTVGGQTGLNLSVELAEAGVLDKYGVELIGAKIDAIKKAEDRLLFKDAMRKIGLETPQSQLVRTVADGLAFAERVGYPVHPAPQLHPRRHRRRHRLQQGRARRDPGARHRPLARPRSPHRRERARLERVRARGHARPRRQLHHRLLHRELRPDGRAHRRLHHGRPRPDPDRPRIPDDARRRHPLPARDRRRYRRLQRAVRHQSRRTAAWSSSR